MCEHTTKTDFITLRWHSIEEEGPPKEFGCYYVVMHPADDTNKIEAGSAFEKFQGLDLRSVECAYFNKYQNLWEVNGWDNCYNADLSKVDKSKDVYISHWMDSAPLPKEN